MKRRWRIILAIALVLAMTGSFLTGCGKTAPADSSGSEAEAESGAEASSESTETEGSSGEEAPAPEADEETGADAAEFAPEITEYFDEDVGYEIEYDGGDESAEEITAAVEGSVGEILTENAEIEAAEIEFAPLTEDEIASIAEEMREEIEEAAENGDSLWEEGSSEEDDGEDQTAAGSGDSSINANASSGPKQLTIKDIQAMNPGATVIDIYTNRGYLSTLVGKYYDKKVTNVEEGVLSIQPMASLLGLSKGCDFFAVYSEKNQAGYTFYTYQQRYGGYTLQYATLRIIVDPQGYTAGLSCSFIPNIGTASKDPAISKAQAEKIVKDRFAKYNLTVYSEHTVRLAVPFKEAVYNCWVVYTDNPDADPAFDMPYIEHCVTTDGKYLTLIPANSFATTNAEVQDHSGYFEGLKVSQYTASFRLKDGTTRKITVPVSYNSKDKKYYLIDPSRKIAVAQYYDFKFKNTVNFVTSTKIDGFSQNNLMAYANYIIMYDFYLDHGIRSIDGFGVPILVTVGWCDKNRTPVNNACFYGVNNGWACFGVSDINDYADCVDVIGHEYTHGVTSQSMQGIAYRNESGSINESYSDIMGNLAEMSGNYTTDRAWKIGEKTGNPDREMSNPNSHRQPQYVGDVYYTPAVLNPDFDVNDYGGVHVNNSLIGHIAYRMDQAGMNYEQQISLWLTSIELITPLSDYQDLHGALLFSLKINGLLEKYGPALNQAFADAGLNENWSQSYLTATKEGYGRVIFSTDEDIASSMAVAVFATPDGATAANGHPDASGRVSVLLPPGSYISQLQIVNDSGRDYYNYTGKGWSEGGKLTPFTVTAGGVTELVGTSGQGGGTAGQGGGNTASSGKLKLTEFDADYFKMLIPEGWRIQVDGQYAYIGIKIWDPNDPSTQMFYYGGLSPYHKSYATRKFWSMYDSTGLISNGPVLSEHNILGILNCWDYCVEYQRYYDRQYFTELDDFYVRGACYYTGPCAKFNAIETTCFTECSTPWDDDCRLAMTSALIDDDIFNVYGGNWFYSCRDLCGVLAPEDRYDEVFEDLLQCLTSIEFSQEYIVKSQNSDFPLAPQPTITANLNSLAGVLYEMRERFG